MASIFKVLMNLRRSLLLSAVLVILTAAELVNRIFSQWCKYSVGGTNFVEGVYVIRSSAVTKLLQTFACWRSECHKVYSNIGYILFISFFWLFYHGT